MNPVQLICLDVDGTLVSPTKENPEHIPEENIKSIQKALKAGIHVCVTTGRFPDSALHVAQAAGINTDYVISYNGGIIFYNGEIIDENPLTKEQVDKLNEIIHKYNLYAQYYAREGYYIIERTKYTDMYQKIITRPPFIVGKEVYNMPVVHEMVIVSDDIEFNKKLVKEIEEIGDVLITVYRGMFIEVNNVGASKGSAVKQLAQKLNIDLKNVMAVGDELNDLSMLNVVGYPVVMGQAKDELKVGKLFTDTCDNAGVSKAIEKYCFNQTEE